MREILDQLAEAKAEYDAAESIGGQITAWQKWCKLWDQKEAFEEEARQDAAGHAL